MKYIQTIFYIFLLNSILFAQAPDTLWTRTFGGSSTEWGYSVQQTTDGGYIITGFTSSFGAGAGDIWLVKTDASGDTLWTRTFGGSSAEWGYSVQQTTDNGYIITGSTISFGTGSSDLWLIKTNINGDILWTKTYGGISGDVGRYVQQTTDGGYIIAGNTQMGWYASNVWLLKTNSYGDTLWTKIFGVLGYNEGYSVQQTTDGGYILIVRQSIGINNFWLIKTDANGDSLWTRTYGGINSDKGESVRQTADGGYIITGSTSSYGAGERDIWLIKTDSNGDMIWNRTYGGSNYEEGGHSVQQTTDGGYILIGATTSFGEVEGDIWMIKTDSDGDTLWTKTFGGSDRDEGLAVQQTTDGGYIFIGMTRSFGAGSNDIWLIKTAPDITGIGRSEVQPVSFTLHQNYPNPFNPATTIEFTIAQSGFVKLKVHNILGQEVATLLEAHKPAGQYVVNFDASQLTSGIYYYTLTVGDFTQTRKMVLLR